METDPEESAVMCEIVNLIVTPDSLPINIVCPQVTYPHLSEKLTKCTTDDSCRGTADSASFQNQCCPHCPFLFLQPSRPDSEKQKLTVDGPVDVSDLYKAEEGVLTAAKPKENAKASGFLAAIVRVVIPKCIRVIKSPISEVKFSIPCDFEKMIIPKKIIDNSMLPYSKYGNTLEALTSWPAPSLLLIPPSLHSLHFKPHWSRLLFT
ncbi:hypothetical protein ACTXT7_016969, partial [Hymenolepis weldensis]